MHSYYLDSLKGEQVITALQNSNELENARFIMFDDQTTGRFNARGRNYRSYEWDGILAKAFGNDLKSAVYLG